MKRIIISLSLGLLLFSCNKEEQHCYEFTSTSHTYWDGESIKEQQTSDMGTVSKYTKCSMTPQDADKEVNSSPPETKTFINGITYTTRVDRTCSRKD